MRTGFDLVLLGAPASGKDTQARLLLKRYSFKPVESGKHWRSLARTNTKSGRMLRLTMDKGLPTPVPLMKKFLQTQIKSHKGTKNLIFVGNPRLKPEAQLLKKILDGKHRDFFVIFIRLPKKEVIKRINLRLDKQGRKDDADPVYIKNRMSWQNPDTSKAVAYFKDLDKLKFVDGNQSRTKVNKEIIKAINAYQGFRRN